MPTFEDMMGTVPALPPAEAMHRGDRATERSVLDTLERSYKVPTGRMAAEWIYQARVKLRDVKQGLVGYWREPIIWAPNQAVGVQVLSNRDLPSPGEEFALLGSVAEAVGRTIAPERQEREVGAVGRPGG